MENREAGDSQVETVWRLARWKIQSLGYCSRRSDTFRVGMWNWYLHLEEDSTYNRLGSSRSSSCQIKLYLEKCVGSEEQLPEASFVFRVSNLRLGQLPRVSSVTEKLFKIGEACVWSFKLDHLGMFIIDLEFLNLKIATVKDDEASSVLLPKDWMKTLAEKSSHLRLARMLRENIHTDITIKVSDGALHAHKAVLVASSPVFCSMFHHDLREKESSIIEIEGMSLESCSAFLNYLYGVIEKEDLWTHRNELLSTADKYDITDLKECCEESLLEDITTDNVLERLRFSWHYHLDRLKKRCLSLLFDFGKINDLKDKFSSFLGEVEQDQARELFKEMLTVWSQA